MGAGQSKEARPEPKLREVHSNILNTSDDLSPSARDRKEETKLNQQRCSSSRTTTTSPVSSFHSSPFFDRNECMDDVSPESAVTQDSSDSEDDLITALRKNRVHLNGGGIRTVLRIHDVNWPLIDYDRLEKKKLQSRKRPRPAKDGQRDHAGKKKRCTQRDHSPKKNPKKKKKSAFQSTKCASFSLIDSDGNHSDKNGQDYGQTQNPKANHREQTPDDTQRTDHPATAFNPVDEIGLTSSQVHQEPSPGLNNELLAGLTYWQDGSPTVRVQGNKQHGIDVQKQVKRSHTKNNKLAPFRRRKPDFPHLPYRAPEPDTQGEPARAAHVVSNVDSGGSFTETRPATLPEALSRPDCDSNQLVCQDAAPNSRQLQELFQTPLTISEVHETALIEQLQSRQRPRETVVPELKWAYTIKYVDSADIILDDEDMQERAITDYSFADREKANKYLDRKTSPEVVGGLDAIVNRTTTLEGPERLLKVDITLANGEHHLMWVERDMVVLKNLPLKKRIQEQWKPNPRPKFPHYSVTCDLIRYDTSLVTRRAGADNSDDDDTTTLSDYDVRIGSYGVDIELQIQKLPSATFTIREKANEYAGKLFLEQTKVDRRFAEPSDVHWWRCNVLPGHKMAVSAARRVDGLYEMEMDVHDMSSRLGWNQILVHVTEVDDVNGPVNF
ncbi:hypothetical protein F4678DRAFT_463603 [Xylaria arbuscula]|nr:hypothetical protein F4678DRAFT_463603 [Xylaria arbuscula]